MQPNLFQARPALPGILTVPGLDGSGPRHWQSLWEARLPGCERVEMGDWSDPVRDEWVARLDRAVAAATGPVVLVAHSLGCLAVAWWTRLRWSETDRHKMAGALLVAPPSDDGRVGAGRVADFCPAPRSALPYPSILVASRNDPCARFGFAEGLARGWGSQFVDAGCAGHINAESGLGVWEDGIAILEGLLTSVADAGRSVQSRLRAIHSQRPREISRETRP